MNRNGGKRPFDIRGQVLETVLRLFSERGYFNTSVHDIRREAGVSIGRSCPPSPPICSSRPFGRMREIVGTGIEAGELRNIDPAVAAAALFGGLNRISRLRSRSVFTPPHAPSA